MNLHRCALWTEATLILVPLCALTGMIFFLSFGLLLTTLAKGVFVSIVLIFCTCSFALGCLTKLSFNYLFNGSQSLLSKYWLAYLALFFIASAIAFFAILDEYFKGNAP